MGTSGLLYLKAIGIRIHTVSYQKVRKRVNQQDHEDRSEHNEESWQSSKEYKRNRGNFSDGVVTTMIYVFESTELYILLNSNSH